MGKLLEVLGVPAELQNELPAKIFKAEELITGMQQIYKGAPEGDRKEALATAIAESTRLMMAEIMGKTPPPQEVETFVPFVEFLDIIRRYGETEEVLTITDDKQNISFGVPMIVRSAANQDYVVINDDGSNDYVFEVGSFIQENEEGGFDNPHYIRVSDKHGTVLRYRAAYISEPKSKEEDSKVISINDMYNIIKAAKEEKTEMRFFGVFSEQHDNGVLTMRTFIKDVAIDGQAPERYIKFTDTGGGIYKLIPFIHNEEETFTITFEKRIATYNAMQIIDITNEADDKYQEMTKAKMIEFLHEAYMNGTRVTLEDKQTGKLHSGFISHHSQTSDRKGIEVIFEGELNYKYYLYPEYYLNVTKTNDDHKQLAGYELLREEIEKDEWTRISPQDFFNVVKTAKEKGHALNIRNKETGGLHIASAIEDMTMAKNVVTVTYATGGVEKFYPDFFKRTKEDDLIEYRASKIESIKQEEELPEDEDYKNWSQTQLKQKKEEVLEALEIFDPEDPEYDELQITLDEVNLYIE